jgi:N-acetylmuramoyl-L-alanine amidase
MNGILRLQILSGVLRLLIQTLGNLKLNVSSKKRNKSSEKTYITSMESYLIILDPGHGKETPGKRSPVWEDGRQLFEYEFNRDIARRIYIGVVDNSIPVSLTSTVTGEEDVPLSDRVKKANTMHTAWDKSLYISIHANAGGGTGWEVFTSKGETDADKYATVFFEEMQQEFPDMTFRKDTSDGDVDKESQFYVLKHTHMPAVLTENFFMDTLDPDCEILFSEEGRQKIADAHLNAIKRIIEIWKNEKN